MHGSTPTASQPFVLPPRPFGQHLIEMSEDPNTLRALKPPVVVHPATDRGVDELRQILQRLVVPGGSQTPLADRGANRLGCLGADRRHEAHEEFSLPVLDPPRLEGVAQEVERYVFVLPVPIAVLAIDDPGFCWMKLQLAPLEPAMDGCQHLLGLRLALAVDDNVVGVPLELDPWELPPDPDIERIVQEHVGQQRAQDATLRGALRPRLQGAVWPLHGSTQPPRHVQADP